MTATLPFVADPATLANPTMTQRHPASTSIGALISPVYAPASRG